MLGTKNRFSALKIDDDEDEKAVKKTLPANQNQSNAAKKKNKKKKEEAEALRNLAFGTGRPSSKPKNAGGGKSGTATVNDWEEWRRRDEECTDEKYRDDMEKALLMSRLEEEKKKAEQQADAEMGPSASSSQSSAAAAGGKKKKKKDKPQAMSLDQFKQLPRDAVPGSDDEVECPSSAPSVQTRVPTACQDPQYFNTVTCDADKILQKERIQEQYQRAYAHESAMQSKYQDDIEKMGKTIAELESKVEEQEAELKKVKSRNVRFCKIFQEAELKEKATVLVERDQLIADKKLLTEQLEELNAELEKERSKNRALKQENDKLKGKHGK